MDKLKTTINRRIASIKRAEGSIRSNLGLISREILEHYSAHGNGTIVVNLLSVLTPMNQSAASKFFAAFIHVDKNGKQIGNAKVRSKVDAERKEFLATEGNLWTWVADNVELKVKEVDLKKVLTGALKKAVEGVDTEKSHADAMRPVDVVMTIFDVVGVDVFIQVMNSQDELAKAA